MVNSWNFPFYHEHPRFCYNPSPGRLATDYGKPDFNELKLLRAQLEANTLRIDALERQLNDSLHAHEAPWQTTAASPTSIPTLSSFYDDAISSLQRQLDNVTEAFLVDLQRQMRLLFTDARNDVKRLEEKTSRWLRELRADTYDQITRLGRDMGQLANNLQGRDIATDKVLT